jgi:hypothetical protein
MATPNARFFTLEEANACLPRLRELLGEIQNVRQKVMSTRPETWPVMQKAVGNGGSKKAGELVFEFKRLEQATQAIKEMGCLLKDADQGLIDFLARREGREVYLCWRYGEEKVAHWHDLSSGFSGRQPL